MKRGAHVSEYEREKRVSLHHRDEEEEQREQEAERTSDVDAHAEEPDS